MVVHTRSMRPNEHCLSRSDLYSLLSVIQQVVLEYLLYLCTCVLVAEGLLALWGYSEVSWVRLSCFEVSESNCYQVLGYISHQNPWDIWCSWSHTERKSHPSSLCEVM